MTRDVVRVHELAGPRGGKILAYVLSCGHLVTRSVTTPLPAATVTCIACYVELVVPKLREERRS